MIEKIDCELAKRLINQQFPKWAELSITPVEPSGWDNRSFRLGHDMLIRLPSAKGYAPQVKKEQQWLPKLAQHLTLQVPKPIAMGEPTSEYPWDWSVLNWIEGQSVDHSNLKDLQLIELAKDLAVFLKELQQIDTHSAPIAGEHNYFRGAHPSIYEQEATQAIRKLRGIVDSNLAFKVWQKALESKWESAPVWVHGDFSAGNVLVKNGKCIAVIDFGCMAIGDPSCDLVIAWTLFEGDSREAFKTNVDLDSETWARASGWALWKALITLEGIEDKNTKKAEQQKTIIQSILEDYQS